MLGYWNRPHETSDVVRDGWFHTGDIGRLDEDGYFFIEERLKDLVIVGGFNVYPAEVENVLYQHPAVAEAAVYGVPDAVMGELVHAAVVPKPGMSLQAHDLIAYCRERLANPKVPVEVEFVHELPKTRTGKVLKRVLRDEHARRTFIEQDSTPVVTDVEELQRRLMGCVGEKLDVDRSVVNINTPFADYGLTTVMAVELAKEVESWVGRPVVPTITWHFSTISALARHLLADRLGFETESSGEITAARVSQLSEEEAEAMLLDELTQLRY
jgi:long-chain acyl-CoA synthetase